MSGSNRSKEEILSDFKNGPNRGGDNTFGEVDSSYKGSPFAKSDSKDKDKDKDGK